MLESEPQILTIGEVARIMNVSIMTIRRWDKDGVLRAFRPSMTKQRRYHKKDVVAFLRSTPETYNIPKPGRKMTLSS